MPEPIYIDHPKTGKQVLRAEYIRTEYFEGRKTRGELKNELNVSYQQIHNLTNAVEQGKWEKKTGKEATIKAPVTTVTEPAVA